MGVVEGLEVVEHLLQVAQPLLADGIGNPVGEVVDVLFLHGMQEGAGLCQIEKSGGQIHHRLLRGGDLLPRAVRSKVPFQDLIAEVLQGGRRIGDLDVQFLGLTNKSFRAFDEDRAGKVKSLLRGRGKVLFDRQQMIIGQEVKDMDEDVAHIGEQLDRSDCLSEGKPTFVVLHPVGVQQLFDFSCLGEQIRQQRAGKALLTGSIPADVHGQGHQLPDSPVHMSAESFVGQGSLDSHDAYRLLLC